MVYLEVDSDSRNLVYLVSQQPTTSTPQFLTLSHPMKTSERNSLLGRLSSYEKCRLARQLSMAVLHFYSTQLMRQPGESQDVVFYGNEKHGPERRRSIETQHLNVQLRSHEVGERHS